MTDQELWDKIVKFDIIDHGLFKSPKVIMTETLTTVGIYTVDGKKLYNDDEYRFKGPQGFITEIINCKGNEIPLIQEGKSTSDIWEYSYNLFPLTENQELLTLYPKQFAKVLDEHFE